MPLSDFDISAIVAIIGTVFLIVIILNKTLELSIPIFGKELDSIGINWKLYVKRNLFWLIVSSLMIFAGTTRAIVIVVTLNNKIKNDRLKDSKGKR